MNGGNGIAVIRQGSKTDFFGAWLMRSAMTVLLAYLAAQAHEQTDYARKTAEDSKSSNEAVIKIKADLDVRLPRMERDIQTLNDKSAKAVTDEQLKAAELRVNAEFTKQLNEQLKKRGLRITTPDN